MGTHSQFLRGTAETLRRIATEADQNFAEAEQALDDEEARTARQDAREHADLAAKYPALERR